MTVREAADFLSRRGYRCSSGTVRALARADRIGHFRVGLGVGRLEFDEAHLERFLRDQYRGPRRRKEPEVPRAEGEVEPIPGPRPKPKPVAAVAAPAPGDRWRELYARERGA